MTTEVHTANEREMERTAKPKGQKRGAIAKRIVTAVVVIVIALFAASAWYVSDYYHADTAADVALASSAQDGVRVSELADGSVAFAPSDELSPAVGLVFYPGAKVQPEAYAPLMRRIAEQGVTCVIVRPPFNLAILDADAAHAAIGQFPDIRTWMIAGHSMGGVAAADYASRHGDDIAGIAFLASYPSVDLSGYEGQVVSVIGTNDGVINRGNYEAAAAKLPPSTRELVIPGGNHAYYGDYGEQAGDGEAAITRDEQQTQTADALIELAQRLCVIKRDSPFL